MTAAVTAGETYEDYRIGDEVWCLAWIGMPFEIVGKDDAARKIFLQGLGTSSLPDGAQVDITEDNLFMLTREVWDQLWYWPDRKGETYSQVFERFVGEHRTGEVVTGYYSSALATVGLMVVSPAEGATFRLDLDQVVSRRLLMARPVAAYLADERRLAVVHDPSIPDDEWLPCGPTMPVTISMQAYRWSLSYGNVILNWRDLVD